MTRRQPAAGRPEAGHIPGIRRNCGYRHGSVPAHRAELTGADGRIAAPRAKMPHRPPAPFLRSQTEYGLNARRGSRHSAKSMLHGRAMRTARVEWETMRVMKKFLAGLWPAAAVFARPPPWPTSRGPGRWRFQEAATPIMRADHWFERYTLWFIVPITLFVLVLAGLVHHPLPRERQPGALAHQPQHADRGRLDRRRRWSSCCSSPFRPSSC